MKNKKRIILVATIAVIVFSIVAIEGETNKDPNVSVKENVTVITEEQANNAVVTETEIILNDYNGNLREDDVIVFPISEATPNGGLYKITALQIDNKRVIITPAYATLGDVFNEANFSQEFELMTDGSLEPKEEKKNGLVGSIFLDAYADETIPSDLKDNFNYLLNLGKAAGVSKNVGTLKAGMNIDIKVNFKVTDKGRNVSNSVVVSVDTGVLAKLKKHLEVEGEFAIIKEKKLPSVQFNVGPIPIVICNSLSIDGVLSANIEYQPEVEICYTVNKDFGYSYNNQRQNKLKKINKTSSNFAKNFNPNKSQADANLELEIILNVKSLLYGSTGLEGSSEFIPIIKGTYYDGEMKAGTKVDGKLAATLLVDIPIIDYTLDETTLWESEEVKLFPTDSDWYNLLNPDDKELKFEDNADLTIEEAISKISGEYIDINNYGFLRIFDDGTCEFDPNVPILGIQRGTYSISAEPDGRYILVFSDTFSEDLVIQGVEYDVYLDIEPDELSRCIELSSPSETAENLLVEKQYIIDSSTSNDITFPIALIFERRLSSGGGVPCLFVKKESGMGES